MKTKKILTGYLIFSVLSGLGLAIWRTVLLYQHYDPYTDKFTHAAGAKLDALGYAMLACLVIAFTSLIFLSKREIRYIEASVHQFSVFASSLVGCLFAAAGVLSLIYYGNELFADRGTVFYRVLLLSSLVSLFIGAAYFLLGATARFDGTKIKKGLSFFPALFAVSYLGAAYLSPDFVFSDSNRLLHNAALAALVFFSIQEMRSSFYGKNEPLRFAFSLTATIALLAYEIPMLIVTAFWEMKMDFMTFFDLVLCGAVIYAIATARTLISGLLPKKECSESEASNT